MQSDVPAVVAELRAVLDKVAALDPAALSDPSLFVGLEELYDVETVVRAVQTRWLSVADTREVTVGIAGRATRSWLVEERNLGGRDASSRLRLARTLGWFPTVEAAFAAARLTADQTAAIVAALLEVPADLREPIEARLIDRATELTPYALTRVVDDLLAQVDVEIGKDRAEAAQQRQLARRGVDLDATFEGTGSLSGTLAPDVHDTVKAALAAAGATAAAGPGDDRTPRQRRHDALGEICAHYLRNAATSSAVHGERPRVVVTVRAADLLAARSGAEVPQRGLLDSGLAAPAETTTRLACDAQLLPVVLDETGDVLRLGRTTRVWSIQQRRAAWIRDDGRCAFPNCRRPPADLHHLVWWSQGGRTDVDNSAWLCAFHHWLVHEARWTVRRDKQRRYVFTAPDGREIGHPPRQPCPPRQPRAA
jgi:hypothetical protein